jgi:hypothetical protein
VTITRVLPKQSVVRDDASSLATRNGWRYHDMFLADARRR